MEIQAVCRLWQIRWLDSSLSNRVTASQFKDIARFAQGLKKRACFRGGRTTKKQAKEFDLRLG